jgi:DNA-binding CsgD family transcriptional regulator
MGKTTLAHAAADEARAAGWLVVDVPSFRIHATLPLFTARRVLQHLIEILGESSARYESGLTIDRERPEEFEEAFLRFVEGVSLDHRLVFLLDDAQWIDEASRTLISRTATALADRAIVLLSTERTDELAGAALPLIDESLALGPLSLVAAIEVVRDLYPGVTSEIAETIATTTRGHAIDLVAVSTAARDQQAKTASDVGESTRRVVARDLTLLEPGMRTFLQLCALIDEPIDLPLLQQLWPQQELLTMIAAASGRYLIEGNDGLRFVHSSVLESVFETIPIEIPLRYRIIDAIKKLPSLRLEDYERLAKQSAACGDKELERETLLKLAEVAASRSMIALALDATERALATRDASEHEIIPLYTRLSQLYNVLGRELDTIRSCRHALALASGAGIVDGIGGIAASLILGLWLAGRQDQALEELERYESLLTSASDRAQILSTSGTIAMGRMDAQTYERVTGAFDQLGEIASPMPKLRIELVHTFFNLRHGDEAHAIEAMRRLDRITEKLPFAKGMAHTAHLFHALGYAGPTAVEREWDALGIAASDPTYVSFRPYVLLSRGLAMDACEFALERLQNVRDPLRRRFLINALATTMTLRPETSNERAWQFVEEEAWGLESPSRSSQLWPIAAAWSAKIANRYPKRATKLLDQLVHDIAAPSDFALIFFPVVIAVAAKALDRRDTLEALAGGDPLWNDPQPWGQAHRTLMKGVAKAYLLQTDRAAILEDASERFTTLGAPFLAEYARAAIGAGEPSPKIDREAHLANTTRREREIASLVAEGLTNRQVAEKLVLSERTVEGHIANLFAKVNVNSRTQLAAWYLRTASSVA